MADLQTITITAGSKYRWNCESLWKPIKTQYMLQRSSIAYNFFYGNRKAQADPDVSQSVESGGVLQALAKSPFEPLNTY